MYSVYTHVCISMRVHVLEFVWFGCLSGSAQSVPQLDWLLCIHHVHPMLQLRAPGVHEGTQHQHSK